MLENDPDTCKFRDPAEEGDAPAPPGAAVSESDVSARMADLPALPENPRFHPGLELGLEDARTLAARRPCDVVGILGAPDAGKTAALVSMYLLLSRSNMSAYSFANSSSLMAFEFLARGTRRWSEDMPSRMTAHTRLADPRSPGFLHLRLKDQSTGERRDVLFPDLPGEWTDELIVSNETARLEFLRSSNVIWLMVNGCTLADPGLRKRPVGQLKLLIGRLARLVDASTRLVLVPTRRDHYQTIGDVLGSVLDEAERLGFQRPEVIEIASFSNVENPGPGFGIERLLEASLSRADPKEFDRRPAAVSADARQVLRYRDH